MLVSNINNVSTFNGFRYSKSLPWIEKYVNPPEFPQVYEDLLELGKHADIHVKAVEKQITKHIAIPMLEYTISPKSFFKRLFSKPYKDTLDVSGPEAMKIANILPLKLERVISALNLS